MKLTQAPDGLQGAFGLKTLGKNPDQFGDELQPSAEVRDFYFDLITAAVAGTATAAGDATSFTVPNGEQWLVWAIGVAIYTDAADVAIAPYGRFDYRPPTATTPGYLGVVSGPARTTLYTNAISVVNFARPFRARPGGVIAFRSETTYTMAALTNFTLMYQPLVL